MSVPSPPGLPSPDVLPRLVMTPTRLPRSVRLGMLSVQVGALTVNVTVFRPEDQDPFRSRPAGEVDDRFTLHWADGYSTRTDPVEANVRDAFDVLSGRVEFPCIRVWAGLVVELAGRPPPLRPVAYSDVESMSRFARSVAAACLLERWRATGDATAGEVLAGRMGLPSVAAAAKGLSCDPALAAARSRVP